MISVIKNRNEMHDGTPLTLFDIILNDFPVMWKCCDTLWHVHHTSDMVHLFGVDNLKTMWSRYGHIVSRLWQNWSYFGCNVFTLWSPWSHYVYTEVILWPHYIHPVRLQYECEYNVVIFCSQCGNIAVIHTVVNMCIQNLTMCSHIVSSVVNIETILC